MVLSIRTYKTRKEDGQLVYHTRRYENFDTLAKGDTFQDRFNNAFYILKEEINKDKRNNDMNIYGPIVISDVFIS